MNLDTWLTQLESAQLVRRVEADESFAFKHTLTQETIYHSLLRATRRDIHLRVARAYEQVADGQLDGVAALLAQHYGEAGDDAKTLEYSMRAGDAAARVYANAEAIMHYTRAVEIAQRIGARDSPLQEVYLKLGRALEMSGRYTDALANYRAMETCAHARGNRAMELASLMARATVHSAPTQGQDLALAQELSNRALSLARELDDAKAESKILWTMMLADYFRSDYPRAVRHGEESLALARRLNLNEQTAFTLNDLSRNYYAVGRIEEGRAVIAQARELWRELDNLPMLADNLATSAEGYFYSGDYDTADRLAREAFTISQSIGNLWNQSYSQWAIGYLAFERGMVADAIHALRQATELGQQAGFVIGAALARGMLGWVYGLMGNPEAGIELVQASLVQAKDLNVPFRAWLSAILAELYRLNGNLTRADSLIQEAAKNLDLNDLSWFAPIFIVGVHGEIALARGEPARVLAMTEDILVRARAVQFRPFVSDILALQGRAWLAKGELNQAQAVLGQAYDDAQALGSRRALWTILVAQSQVAEAHGDLAAAETMRTYAREVIAFIAAHTPEDSSTSRGTSLRESFLSLPAVRAVIESR
ncbi:MAG: hypothetical protein HY868_19350 [Chloroflexi bacterium]|nr:hypothetical protein [Chloroflexota bacterium]